ncbi:DOMON-like domain-containing protein [Parasphingopyxis marina]|uniref:DOMON-like domain-containing protein n=1 Tax=Parasphingopyxis marina TaxID=2761622 RepID=A0A842HUR9_9SPHN|nr:DOMON-like domain-containing protein [Parasphingopyxis marina]MBC2777738.1 DOMON-like domain-containing protein [Parasphingopyxis marina]
MGSVRRALVLHPDCRCDAVETIEVQIARPGAGELALRFVVKGDIASIAVPAAADPGFADGLWKHSCFEAFAGSSEATAYHEFNFSPSSQWAAYRFDDYRSGMAAIPPLVPPEIDVDASACDLQLAVALAGLTEAHDLFGLSAVIEQVDGTHSYWALAHPLGKPDFHHKDCFALELPAASAS